MEIQVFSQFVRAHEATIAKFTITMGTQNKVEAVRNPQILHMLTPSQAFKLSRDTSSYMSDNASESRLEHLGRERRCSFITPNQQSTHHSATVVKSNVPDIHACNPFCIDTYHISRPIRRTVIFWLEILEKKNDCILILVIYWKKTGLLHTKIRNHDIINSP